MLYVGYIKFEGKSKKEKLHMTSQYVLGSVEAGFEAEICWWWPRSRHFKGQPEMVLTISCTVSTSFMHVFKYGPTPASFCLFLVFSNKQYNFYNKSMWKMSKSPSSIWHRDSKPQPYKHESSPITTRPGLPPIYARFYIPFNPQEGLLVCFKSRLYLSH